jgi:hypothetical protein
MNQIQNPFDHEENLSTWFNQDAFYSNSKLRQLQQFKTHLKQSTNHQNNQIMSFQESYKNFVNTITKHSITATLIMLLALSTVSVAAAQLFAPEDLKPSNLTGLTKKPEPKPQPTKEEEKPLNMNKEGEIKTEVDSKNMEAPLKWDNENDVILVDSCDLQMKFPKESVNQGMKSKNNSINKTDNGVVIEYNFEFGSGPTHSYFISCEDKILTLEQYEKENSNALTGDPNGLGRPTVIDISKQELCNQLGFIAASCDKISNTKKIIKPTAESNLVSYYFTGLDKTFIISSFVQFKDDTYPEFAAKYITKTAFQFNSLSNPKLQAQSTTPAPTKKLLSYTNPYFPDFKLV